MNRAHPHDAPLQPLRRLQQSLEALYRLEARHDIADFVTTDVDALGHLGIDVAGKVEETVFVQSDEEAIRISVYFDPQTLGRLATAEATGDGMGLNDYCLAAEGVSHFIFIVERAGQQRQTSAFELELQAEVDKFLLLTGLCNDSPCAAFDDVHQRLFDGAVFRDGLEGPSLARYDDANRYAARYCRWLQRHARSTATTRVADELRHFYHLPLSDKIQRIESRPYV